MNKVNLDSRIELVLSQYNRPITVARIEEAPQCYRVRVIPQRRVLASGKPGAMTQVGHLKSLTNDIAPQIGVAGVIVTVDEGGIWLEIPKDKPDLVRSADLCPPSGMSLPVVLGVDVKNRMVCLDLSDPSTPHILIAGTTGSGKSVLLHSVINSLCRHTNFMDTQIVVVDTHSPEGKTGSIKDGDGLGVWRDKAHVYQVATEARTALVLLKAAVGLVRQRYDGNSPEPQVRYIFVIDELADLLGSPEYGAEIGEVLVWLLANARKQGVHIVAATQRPSSDVTKGLMKANFPARIAMTVASPVDSRIAIGQAGAEVLNGKGDAVLRVGMKLVRFQAAWTDDVDVRRALGKFRKEVPGVKKSRKGVPWWQKVWRRR